jgi:PIN domain nuclease of toxin-antitoxin system
VGRILKLLLDTHALLWWWTNQSRLSKAVLDAIGDEANTVCISAASAFELATKVRIGKLNEAVILLEQFDKLVAADGFTHLGITHRHTLRAGSYAFAHKDPFDRLLIAQSEIENLTFVSCDAAILALDVKTLW